MSNVSEVKERTGEEIWDAAWEVMRAEHKPLEIWRIAQAAGISEGEVIAKLIRVSTREYPIQFRYPPLPCAAITKIWGRRKDQLIS